MKFVHMMTPFVSASSLTGLDVIALYRTVTIDKINNKGDRKPSNVI
jgi:hypothetical protein